MSQEHHFRIPVAMEVGVNAAIILEHFDFWITKNRANERHFHDGSYWTYNSVSAFSEIYPYMSKKVIRSTLRKLEDGGYIIVGDYSPDRMNRPNWYSITEKGYALLNGPLCPKGQNDLPPGANRVAPEGNTLNICTYSSSSTSSCSSPKNGANDQRDQSGDAIKAIIDYFNQKVGTRYTYRNKKINSLINARLGEGFTVEDFKTVIDNKVASWAGTEWEQYLKPTTLFAPSHFEDYLNEKPTRKKGGGIPDDYDTAFYG